MLASKLIVFLALVAFVISCEDDTSTTAKPTPSLDCAQYGMKSFKRKNGYWCANLWTYGKGNPNPVRYKTSNLNCEGNGHVLSSLETEEEYKYWTELALLQSYNLTGIWVGVASNTTHYYWNDGQAIRNMTPQPEIVTPGGQTAWFINRDMKTTPGLGTLRVVNQTGFGSPIVNAGLCGRPGRQFN